MADTDHPTQPPAPAGRPLSAAARRALEEASARRAALERRKQELARTREINGRGGLDPVRYDDWEIKGLASDF
jgi:hypothetical protein